EGCRRHCSDDNLVFPNTRIVAAIRSELSLSIPGFECDLYHADGSNRAEGKAKYATYDWRAADQRGDRVGFTQLARSKNCRASAPLAARQIWQATRLPYNGCVNNGHNSSKAAKLIARI